MATLNEVARAVQLDPEIVRQILNEMPGLAVSKTLQDQVFKTARDIGFDFKKFKVSRKLELRHDLLVDLIDRIEAHPEWSRAEILKHLRGAADLVTRGKKQ